MLIFIVPVAIVAAILISIVLFAKPATKISKNISSEPKPTEARLLEICNKLEDAELIENIKQIANYQNTLTDTFKKYPNTKNEALVNSHIEQLIKYLDDYNDAEDLQASLNAKPVSLNEDTLDMMANVCQYAEDLLAALKNIHENSYTANAQVADAAIDALRADLRIRGLSK
ncbi:MAG: hypothetical protein LBV04_05165 [Deferribacteraceae bacterium]|nr:hypothetical protein [Deferribacteraceae bacterium]